MDAVIEQINTTGRGFVDFAWPMLWQSSALIVILLALDFILRRKVRAVFRYWLWMIVFIKLILPTTLSSPVSVGQLVGEPLAAIKISATESPALSEAKQPVGKDFSNVTANLQPEAQINKDQTIPSVSTDIQRQPIAQAVSVTWQGAVFLGWAVIVIVMVLLLAQRAIFVCGLVRQSEEVNDLMKDMLGFCRKIMNVRGQIGLKISPNATSPAVCGLFRPVILLPNGLGSTLGSSQLRIVLMHELAHIRRGDLWMNLLATLMQIVYFYNPLLWVANWAIRRVREQSVDETVQVALGDKAGQYPETLLNVARMAFERPALSLRLTGVVESKGALTGRIKRMLTQPIPKTAKLGIIGLAAIIVFAAVILPMAKAVPPAEFIIKGTVTDAQTGAPIAGAKVGDTERYADGKYGAVTDSKGNYSYKTWYEEHNIIASAEGYKPQTNILLTKAIGSEKEKTINFQLATETAQQSVTTDSQRPRNMEEQRVDGGFKATLPNGVTVELIGICEYPAEGKKWWRPDGKELEETFKVKETDTISASGKPYVLLFKIAGPNEKYFSVDIESSRGQAGPSLLVTDSKGLYIKNLLGIKAFIAEQLDETKIKVNVAAGPWTTDTGMSYNGIGISSMTNDEYGVLFSTPQQTDKGVVLVVSDNSVNRNIRIIAIDDNNEMHTGSDMTGETTARNGKKSPTRQTTTVFSDIALKKIKEFQFQTRPLEWAEFKNVSLRAGVKTDVQVVVEDKQAKAEKGQPVINAAEFGKTEAKPDENAIDYSLVTVQEGVGFDGFIVGDAKCTGEFIKAKLGKPEEENKDERQGWWIAYHKKFGLDFWLNLQENTLYEIRLNKGFKGKLTSGITISSTKQDVFKTYGEPIRETAADNLTNLFDDRVLFVGKDGISKINYKEKGVLFWFDGGKINQIRVGAISTPGKVDAAVEDLSTPEAAYASINRISASGDLAGWQRASLKELAENLKTESKNGKMVVEPEWSRVLLNAKILEVRIWENKMAMAAAKLPQEFSTQEIRKPIDIRYLKLKDGKWLNTGNERVDTIEEARALFNRMCGKATTPQ